MMEDCILDGVLLYESKKMKIFVIVKSCIKQRNKFNFQIVIITEPFRLHKFLLNVPLVDD